MLRSYQNIPKQLDTQIKPEKRNMSSEKETFELAANAAKSLPQRPDDQTMLKLYALFKQGSAGDVSGEKPGFFDFVGAAKFEAWGKLKGTGQEDARSQYVELVKKLGGKF
jgi:diazepam-binding inhibitor (GABA receptor modulating acyl-CoA-binding protein)